MPLFAPLFTVSRLSGATERSAGSPAVQIAANSAGGTDLFLFASIQASGKPAAGPKACESCPTPFSLVGSAAPAPTLHGERGVTCGRAVERARCSGGAAWQMKGPTSTEAAAVAPGRIRTGDERCLVVIRPGRANSSDVSAPGRPCQARRLVRFVRIQQGEVVHYLAHCRYRVHCKYSPKIAR